MKVGLGIAFALLVFGGVAAWAQVSTSGSRSGRGAVRSFTFDTSESLSGWTVTGDVTIDPAKGREGTGGALKIAPGGKAELKLRNRDQSGTLELWVYDDGSKPQNPRASHVGPR